MGIVSPTFSKGATPISGRLQVAAAAASIAAPNYAGGTHIFARLRSRFVTIKGGYFSHQIQAILSLKLVQHSHNNKNLPRYSRSKMIKKIS